MSGAVSHPLRDVEVAAARRRLRSARRAALLALGLAAGASVAGGATPRAEGAATRAVAATAAVKSQPSFAGLHLMPGKPGYAPTNLGQVHYWDLGQGPALLLLHGGPMFGVQFAKVMPLLAKAGYRVIAADLPAFGLSDLPDHAATGAEYADAMAGLLDHLGVTQASVAGMLTGGVVTLAFATRHPQRVRCVALMSTPVYSAGDLKEKHAEPANDTRIYADGRHVGERWRQRQAARPMENASPEALQWLMIGGLLAGDPETWWAEGKGGEFVSRSFDTRQAVIELRAPALVITLREDPMARHAQRMLRLRPDFRHASLDVGHALVPYDYPEPWARAVLGFLQSGCVAPG
jgi:pimeloyl-ACP methyl ester carboxylesterase